MANRGLLIQNAEVVFFDMQIKITYPVFGLAYRVTDTFGIFDEVGVLLRPAESEAESSNGRLQAVLRTA